MGLRENTMSRTTKNINDNMPKYGQNIRMHRIEKDLSAKTLGMMVSKSANTITAYERGTRIPSLKLIRDIAEAMDVDVKDIIQSTSEYYSEVGALLPND